MSEHAVRVVVVDDQRLIREGIAALLSIQPGIEVVGVAADGVEALSVAEHAVPDVVLMDVRMPGMDGILSTAEIKKIAPRCKVLMLTTFDDHEYVRGALTAGAHGYLLKDRPADEIAAAVRLAHAGVAQLDPAALDRLVRSGGASPSPGPGSPELTPRELEVLRALSSGATNREIARAPLE